MMILQESSVQDKRMLLTYDNVSLISFVLMQKYMSAHMPYLTYAYHNYCIPSRVYVQCFPSSTALFLN